ncbi:MAG: TonB-dependent receptor plug domain-containing protein, partial [Saprospiraceae bacterium]|nr:TonB-dependent receptor plug domain-containing protein [Saprospiraceae bacterium]
MQKHLLTYYIIILLLGVNISVYGQSSDTLQNLTLQTITITAFKEKPAEKNAAIITAFSLDSVNPTGNFNLTDRIAQIPGVDLLGTGPAISKPVIRGSYGNRILILLNGLKFDNQQWQDEHGLGLSDLGLSKVEIIKGPLGVLYGSEALGGVINLIEEEKPSRGQSASEFGLRFNTNTLGGLIQGGWQKNAGKHWWRIRGGIENHADYRNGKSQRVLNSRFTGYHLKGTFGFLKKNWRSTNNLMSSFTQSGFIFNDIYNFITPDARWSRNLSENPSHLVILNVLSSENKIHFAESDLYFNVGIQSNDRLENEGAGAISLNIHLLTFQYLLKWERNLSTKTRLIISHLHSFKINTNYGARKIIPDANLHEANASVYLETTVQPGIILENGFGLG